MSTQPLLDVRELYASVDSVEILKGVDLQIYPGQVHAIMGPNGSGKSTLAHMLVGNPLYQRTGGEVLFQGHSLLKMKPELRAQAGLFLGFQNPSEIPGVRFDQFLRTGYNAICKSQGFPELDPLQFDRLLQRKMTLVDMDPSLARRSVNQGFSGGEKKRNEILQMAVLEPRFAILDEPDSGLDVDALREVAHGINQLRSPDRAMLLITHYQRILSYVVPDIVHVLVNGRIACSGDKELALEIEANGYDKYQAAT